MLDSNLPAVADTLQTLAQNSSKVSPGLFVRIMQIISIWLIPVLIFAILILDLALTIGLLECRYF